MCYESDSNDTHQLITTFNQHITSLRSNDWPCVVALTCSDFTSLPDRLTSVVLAHHHITPPDSSNRSAMLTWLSRQYSIELSKNILDYIVSESASFVLADLRRLLALAELEKYKCDRCYLEVEDFVGALGMLFLFLNTSITVVLCNQHFFAHSNKILILGSQ